jgi:GTP-binding protein
MTEGNFVDYVKINVASGNGGSGSKHFRREKYITKGGPDGGDGGRGGHVILKGNKNLWTLISFKFKRHFKAEHGESGSKNRSAGAFGKDLIIPVPLGTVVYDSTNNQKIIEINDEQDHIIIEGGKGGKGNWHFRSSTNQTPRYSQPGIKGVEKNITLELKVLADVGLVGFPNAGKSTLLKSLTAAKPKIADYPFTTLKPNLGIVKYRSLESFVIADIPGIIEGASEGKGLGHYFLRHIERNSILLFIISCDSKSIKKEFLTLRNELERYSPELIDKKFIVGISKKDLLDKELQFEILKECKEFFKKIPFIIFSSISNEGIRTLKDTLWKTLNS